MPSAFCISVTQLHRIEWGDAYEVWLAGVDKIITAMDAGFCGQAWPRRFAGAEITNLRTASIVVKAFYLDDEQKSDNGGSKILCEYGYEVFPMVS